MLTSNSSIMALDIGGRRIGIATANAVARMAHPLTTIENNEATMANLQKLITQHDTALLVFGLPRGLDGQRTGQTEFAEQFAAELAKHITLPVYWQDEALTSVKAKEELAARGKDYQKGEVDALAATYILEDFLGEHPEITA